MTVKERWEKLNMDETHFYREKWVDNCTEQLSPLCESCTEDSCYGTCRPIKQCIYRQGGDK